MKPLPKATERKTPETICPKCDNVIAKDGVFKPDGPVICPKCFKRFIPDRK